MTTRKARARAAEMPSDFSDPNEADAEKNPRATQGANNPPPDEEPRPRKKDRIIDIRMAKRALVGGQVIALLGTKRYEQIVGKRQSDECLIYRRALQLWLDGKGCPKWMQAEIFMLSREAPGAEIKLLEEWMARNACIECAAENIIEAMDLLDTQDLDVLADAMTLLLKVEPKRFLQASLSELEADRAAENARRVAKEAADALEPAAGKLKKPKALTEAERLVMAGQDKRRAAQLAQSVAILESVIRAGEKDKASKEQKADAKRARKELAALLAALQPKTRTTKSTR